MNGPTGIYCPGCQPHICGHGVCMRRFHLQRHHDETGVSGVGRVAEGVVFSNGWVALTWLTEYTSVVFYPGVEHVKEIHGHGGFTEIVFED